jgi:hypothetical protein
MSEPVQECGGVADYDLSSNSARRRDAHRLQDRPVKLLLDAALFLVNIVGWGTVLWLWGSILWGPRP